MRTAEYIRGFNEARKRAAAVPASPKVHQGVPAAGYFVCCKRISEEISRMQPSDLQPDVGRYEEQCRMVAGWRGRRLLACNAVSTLHDVIDGLASDNGADLPPVGRSLPTPPSAAQIRELQNLAAVVLRQILLWNDGSVSPQELRRH